MLNLVDFLLEEGNLHNILEAIVCLPPQKNSSP